MTAIRSEGPLRMAGIGEVSVASSHRRQKIATRLLQEALKEISLWADVSFLHTGSAKPLYESLGWTAVPKHFVSIDLSQPFITSSVLPPLWTFDLVDLSTSSSDLQVCLFHHHKRQTSITVLPVLTRRKGDQDVVP